MQMLKAKLYMLRQEEQAAKAAGIRGDVKDNGWGSQIRSYVLQPYTMVKDLRTGEETGIVFHVADGLLEAVAAGATAVIQPGGSMRDAEVIAAAQAAGVTMYLTGTRHFFH